jgi:hypothetical protein
MSSRSTPPAPPLAERFAQALGTNDAALLEEIYDPEVALYTPLGPSRTSTTISPANRT